MRAISRKAITSGSAQVWWISFRFNLHAPLFRFQRTRRFSLQQFNTVKKLTCTEDQSIKQRKSERTKSFFASRHSYICSFDLFSDVIQTVVKGHLDGLGNVLAIRRLLNYLRASETWPSETQGSSALVCVSNEHCAWFQGRGNTRRRLI